MCSVLVPHASAKLQNDCEAFQPGDMICLTGKLFSFHKSNLVLCTGKERNNGKISEVIMVFSENINMRKIQWDYS